MYVKEKCNTCVISDKRARVTGELTPVRAEHSLTYHDNENYAAARSIDLDFGTHSWTLGSDSNAWLKLTLDQVYCVEQIVRYGDDGSTFATWTCSQTDCTACEGDRCGDYSLTVSSVGAVLPDNLPPVTDCKYGDTVKLEETSGGSSMVFEIAITRKQGEITHW